MSGLVVYSDPHARCTHRRYRMTCEEYDALEAETGGRCQVCATPVTRHQIDHDHAVGQWAVRGLVCRLCNSILRDVDHGRREADTRVANYLERAWHIGRSEPEWAPQPKRRRELAPVGAAAGQVWHTEEIEAWAKATGRKVNE